TAPTGPRNGSGEIISAAEAPLMHRMSCGVTMSAERVVQITCTSFLNPFGQSGRIGRSIIRAVRIAFSVGRPSRLKKPPGILPAAAADELQEAAPRVVVLRVRAQMLRELVDAPRQQRDLNLRRAGVGVGTAMLADDLLLRFLGERHSNPPLNTGRRGLRSPRQ